MLRVLLCLSLLITLLSVTGCNLRKSSPTTSGSLRDARKGFTTTLVRKESSQEPLATPPASMFQVVNYKAPGGMYPAYLTNDPNDGKKHSAIIWITGGDCNTIGNVWSPASQDNDQTASAYRNAGMIMMFPSLRGGNMNPGFHESFLGEVDDVLAAADFLAAQPSVDPKRIYLGGHSTGGTLVLLTAECSDRFRAVFSFGPVDDPRSHSISYITFNPRTEREVTLRSPGKWLHCIKSLVFVIEGEEESNINSLRTLERKSTNPYVHFLPIKQKTHFSVLSGANDVIAKKILQDTGETTNISLTAAEIR
ncbi:MAG: prolyl oligopeptidase family serine peptidase [Chloroflexota bacterium]